MFKKFQDKLLLTNPLLWNTKIVPAVAAGLLINLIFFAIGYGDGAIDFKAEERWDMIDDTSFVISFFAIVVGSLALLIWMVFYFRNNAFKSFYPLRNSTLYKEWLLILVVCLLNCLYSASYREGKVTRIRSYMAETEFNHRANVISMSSLFASGSFDQDGDFVQNNNGTVTTGHRDYFIYRANRYPLNSLLNKNLEKIEYTNHKQDSLNELRVKGWLVENRKDSVLWLMKEMDKIVKAHDLKSNVTPQQWLNLVYNYPDFTKYINVGTADEFVAHNISLNNTEEEIAPVDRYIIEMAKDTLSNRIEVIDGETHIFPRYFVPVDQLKESYGIISDSWSRPDIDADGLLAYMYFALMLSMAILSFRVTTGRNWLIAAITLGLVAMLTGVVNIAASSGMGYLVIWIVITVALLLYYLYIATNKQQKEKTATVLNSLLWLLPWVLPMIYAVIAEMATPEYYDSGLKRTPFDEWIHNNFLNMMYVNILIVLIYMYFLTVSIKKWKGIPEA